MKNVNIAIVGANGYSGAALVRIIDKHPKANFNSYGFKG